MADIAFEKDLSVAETGIGGPQGRRPRRPRRLARLVQGELAARQDDLARASRTSASSRTTSPTTTSRGVTRGIHAEPWDKFISVARGSVFGAWVDLREGSATYGKCSPARSTRRRPSTSRAGVGNSFQALEDGTAYTYLVTPTGRWS